MQREITVSNIWKSVICLDLFFAAPRTTPKYMMEGMRQIGLHVSTKHHYPELKWTARSQVQLLEAVRQVLVSHLVWKLCQGFRCQKGNILGNKVISAVFFYVQQLSSQRRNCLPKLLPLPPPCGRSTLQSDWTKAGTFGITFLQRVLLYLEGKWACTASFFHFLYPLKAVIPTCSLNFCFTYQRARALLRFLF